MSENGLRTKDLTIGYKSDLVSGICLEVLPGRIVTLIGPNGCGKSTLLKSICGSLDTRGGVVYLNGRDMASLKSGEIAKEMSLVMTTPVKPGLITCREVIETGRYPYTGMLGILSQHDREVTDRAIALTDTGDVADKQFDSISDGQRQRVMLARAICQEPEVLILDEPTSYLDIRYRLDILGRIRQLATDNDMAVIMSLHELDIAMRISDTVVAMGDGEVRRIGTPKDVFTEDFIRDLFGIDGMDTGLLGNDPWFESYDKKESAPAGTDTEEADRAPAGTDTEGTDHAPAASGRQNGRGKARVIMVQGTMSNAGKSLIAAGLCRIFKQDGYRVAPFKSQNMALNSYITEDGLEMGRAQVVQAECCGISPRAAMNPILLKPVDDIGSQVIVNGKPVGNMKAAEYFRHKKELIPEILKAYDELAEEFEIIVVEGAGSPVELNLKADDIVNMGLAEMLDAPVLLVGDIDRGGVFAQLIGTLDLLPPSDRERVKGLIVNKFRGDIKLFDDGVEILKEKSGKDVVGVVPYMDIRIDEEDSLSTEFSTEYKGGPDIAVIRLPHISNYTDVDVFAQAAGVSVRYVKEAGDLGRPDMLIIPGTKNTIGDLRWLKEKGLDERIRQLASDGTVIFGICGGYQILGRNIADPDNTEVGSSEEGLGLLPVDTVMDREKTRTIFNGRIENAEGVLADLKGVQVEGYEIHTGVTTPFEDLSAFTSDGTGYCRGNVFGTYIHGIFDRSEAARGILTAIALHGGKAVDTSGIKDMKTYREEQYEALAAGLREALDMGRIYEILGLGNGI